MRRTSIIFLICITGALFIALVFMGFPVNWDTLKSEAPWGGNLLLAVPMPGFAPNINLDDLEELNETKFMLTYEVNQEKTVQAINSQHNVIVKGTNYTYPFVMDCNILSGGFFTKEAQDQKSRVVVLNERAAFEIFGSAAVIGNEIPINGYSYLITGVIDDGDSDNKNLYTPLAHLNTAPDTFISVLNEKNGISAAYIQNEYKQIGITEEKYDFTNLDALSRIIREKVYVSVQLIILAFVAFGFKKSLCKLLSKSKSGNKRLAVAGIFVFTFGSISVWIASRCLETLITWSGYMRLEYTGDCFFNLLRLLESRWMYSNIFFVAFVLMLVVCWFLSLLTGQG